MLENEFNLSAVVHWYVSTCSFSDTNVLTLVSQQSSGFISVQSTLEYKVIKEDKDARFSCEVSFFVPGAIRTVESNSINITVHCKLTLSLFIHILCLCHISC